MITYVPHSGNPLWLDTTPGVAPFNMLMAGLRDKQALVIPSDKPAELKTTPANPPFPADLTFNIEGAIDSDGTLKAHVKQTVRGDNEVILRVALRATAPAQWKDLIQRISNAQGFGGEVSNANASSPEDTVNALEFSYDYTRKKYSDWENHRIGAPLPFTGLEGAAVLEKKPADPVLLGGLGELVYTAKITVPTDVEMLPTDVSLKEPYADFSSTYSHVGNVLLAKRQLKIKQNEVPLASWESYKKFSKALVDDWDARAELYAAAGKEKDVANTASAGVTPDDDRHELWQKAWDALQRNDLTSAEDILRQALKKYPDGIALHGTLGEVYARRNDRESAFNEFRKEEELHPDNAAIYQVFAGYALYLKRDDMAADQLRKWIEHDPKNYDAYDELSRILYRQKNYPAMLALWEGAAKQLPDNDHVKSSLGYAYLYNKQPDKGVTLIEQSLTSDSKPMEFNHAAYAFADQNVHLDKAKEWGEKALRGVQADSLKTESEDTALVGTRQMIATWDTVGWTYYRLADYAKAEAYLRSAFTISQDAVEGDHLGQTYQKQGKKQEAEHTYKLAYSAAGASQEEEVKKHYRELMGNDADPEESPVILKRGSQTKSTYGAADELSRARTTKITTAAHGSGSATFSVVFSPGKIEDVTFVNGEEKLKPMATQIASSKLRAEFPDSTPARLTQRGVLVCGMTGCDFTLLLPDSAYATASAQ